jgi:signal transduction histidine kinase
MLDETHANLFWNNRAAPLIVLSLSAIFFLWRRRSSVLDLWLLVVIWAWLIETTLLSTTGSRFSLVWYTSRAFGLMSSGFVLLILLSESTMLYARLALSVAARERERDGQNMTLELIVRSMAHELHQPLSAIMLNGDAAAIMLSQSAAAARRTAPRCRTFRRMGARLRNRSIDPNPYSRVVRHGVVRRQRAGARNLALMQSIGAFST